MEYIKIEKLGVLHRYIINNRMVGISMEYYDNSYVIIEIIDNKTEIWDKVDFEECYKIKVILLEE